MNFSVNMPITVSISTLQIGLCFQSQCDINIYNLQMGVSIHTSHDNPYPYVPELMLQSFLKEG